MSEKEPLAGAFTCTTHLVCAPTEQQESTLGDFSPCSSFCISSLQIGEMDLLPLVNV